MGDIITVFGFVKEFVESEYAEPDIMKDYNSFWEFYAKLEIL